MTSRSNYLALIPAYFSRLARGSSRCRILRLSKSIETCRKRRAGSDPSGNLLERLQRDNPLSGERTETDARGRRTSGEALLLSRQGGAGLLSHRERSSPDAAWA